VVKKNIVLIFKIESQYPGQMKRSSILFFLLAAMSTGTSAQSVMRITSPWPKGSAIMKILASAGETIKTKTGGKVTLSISYDASLAANEGSTVNKMAQGTVDATFLTTDGLTRIDQEFTVLDLPFLITTENELVRIRTQLAGDFANILEKAGFSLGCWATTGPSYIFSKPRVSAVEDLRNVRFAVLNDDATGRNFLSRIPASSTPMGLPDILPGLTTGTVTGYIGTCLNSVRYEWNMKVRYMVDIPVRCGTGAFLIRKAFLGGLPEEQREVVSQTFQSMEKELNAALAADNASAERSLTRLTITPVSFPEGSAKELQALAEPGWRENAGKLYSTAMLQKVRIILGK
jgi:TRAP-type C4-dicarboxylate transport system substrate-binding protein